MKSSLFRCAAVLVIPVLFGLPRSATGREGRPDLSAAPAIRFHQGTTARDIPFRYELGHIILPVQIADTLVEMMLDSGLGLNGAVLLDPDIGEALGLAYSGQLPLGGGGTARPVVANVSRDAVLSVPGVTFSGQMLLVVTDPEPFRNFPGRGIVGRTLFDCVVEIDYAASRINLHQGSSYRPPEGCESFDVVFSHGIPVMEARVSTDGIVESPVKLIVDTGAVQLLLFDWTGMAVPRPPILVTGRERLLSKGFNGTILGATGRIARLQLGPHILRQVVTSFPDSASWGSAMILGQEGMLGNDGLRRFFVAFDYAHQQIHLRPNARFDEPFEFDMSGFVWEPTPDGTMLVVDVIPQSPAAESGVEPGDRILALDGRSPGELGWVEVERLLMRDGVRLRMTVLRGMERLEKDVVTRRLI